MARRTGGPVAGIMTVAAAFAFLSLGSWIELPMLPVPMTLQTLVVLLLGILAGWRLALGAILAWIAAGALGAPVFAGGASGWDRLTGPTAGYLVAFPIAAVTVALSAARGGTRGMARTFATLLFGHAICLLLGTAWLARLVGAEAAIADGFVPFIPGAVVKSLAGAAVLALLRGRR